MTGAAQQKNVRAAAVAIAQVIRDGYDVVLTHGNGPQVGLLALHQQDAFSLDVLGSETQGMIGYMLEAELRNVLPKTAHVAALLTQVEVDAKDPAFEPRNATKPIGPHYDEDRSAVLGPMVRVGDKWRRVVASPEPQRIVEIDTIRTLLAQQTLVICAGGGGIPVATNPITGLLHGVTAVIDKDRTAALLAEALNADALVMLTDVDCIYENFGKPEQRRVPLLDGGKMGQTEETKLLQSLPAGSMRPKLEGALRFARKSGGEGWAAIGSLGSLPQILAGTAGTRVVCNAQPAKRVATPSTVSKEVKDWTREDVQRWLVDFVRVPRQAADALVASGATDGNKLMEVTYRTMVKAGISWGLASAISREISMLSAVGGTRNLSWIDSEPYAWPYNGSLNPSSTVSSSFFGVIPSDSFKKALVIIDMQRDFLDPAGYIGSMGYSTEGTRKTIEPIGRLLKEAREQGYHVIHTREGHQSDLSDCPGVKHWRSLNLSTVGIGDRGPLGRLLIRGEEGWNIIPELAPLENEVVIDKPGKGAFFATSLDFMLRISGIKNLILTGVTTDVCVHTTMREANDRGYECLLVTDATAALDPGVHRSAVRTVQLSGGIFGATADSHAVLKAMAGSKRKD
jgi:carbamate kinase